jgi:hypothetical protein
MQAEQANFRVAVRWLFAHDIAAPPHMLQVLWRFWQLRDGMTEGRAWVSSLLPRASELDTIGQAELWLTAGMIGGEVGDDEGALKARDAIVALQGQIDDPYVKAASQLAMSWALPIVDDLEGAVVEATRALEGFALQDEPFMAANARFTVGMLEMSLGRNEDAERHLREVDETERSLGATWLTSVARTQLAAIAVASGRVQEARTALVEAAQVLGADHSSLMLSFLLVAYARLACAEGRHRLAAVAIGATEGLRQRSGSEPWPMIRRSEAELRAQIEAALSADEFTAAFAEGSALSRAEILARLQEDGITTQPSS